MSDIAQAEIQPYDAIPKVGALRILSRILLGGSSERIDMLTPLRTQHQEKGSVVRQISGPFRMVNLFGPDACQAVLMDRDGIMSAQKPWTQIMGRIFPNGLLLRDGENHRQHRRLMHQAFRRPVLQTYVEHMAPMVESGISSWGQQRNYQAFHAVKELTLDMAARIFMGVDLGPESRRINRAFEDMVAASMSRIRLRIPGLEFYNGLQGREVMTSFLRNLIPSKRAGDGEDMFSQLCRAEDEDGSVLDDQEIIDHMIFLMMAAHDTTTSTLSSMIYELGRHGEWQERVRDEARALGKSVLEFADVESAQALTWVMKETLRRYPPLPVIPRVTLDDFDFDGYRIPRSSMVVVSPIHTHHMEEWWTDPFTFDPARFSPERDEQKRHTFMWIPFGGGPHHCIGFKFAEAQIKGIMHQMVLRYRWKLADGYSMPVQQAPISKPMDGLPVELEPLQ